MVRWFARRKRPAEEVKLKPPAEPVRYRRVRRDLPEIEPVASSSAPGTEPAPGPANNPEPASRS